MSSTLVFVIVDWIRLFITLKIRLFITLKVWTTSDFSFKMGNSQPSFLIARLVSEDSTPLFLDDFIAFDVQQDETVWDLKRKVVDLIHVDLGEIVSLHNVLVKDPDGEKLGFR